MNKVGTILLPGAAVAAAVALYLAGPSLMTIVRPTLASIGGTRVVLGIDPTLDATAAEAAAKADNEVIERRVDSMDWRGAGVRREGARRLVVEVPGVFDTARVARVVAARGALTFHLVRPDPPADAPRLASLDPSEPALAVLPQSLLDGDHVVDASPGTDERTGTVVLNFRLDAAGTSALARATSEHVRSRMAIVLDDKILTAPLIITPITGGVGQIGGNFTVAQAREFATLLRAGRLTAPVAVEAAEEVAKR